MTTYLREAMRFGGNPLRTYGAAQERVREEFYKIYPAENITAKKGAFGRNEREAIERGIMVSRELETATWFWLARKEDEIPTA